MAAFTQILSRRRLSLAIGTSSLALAFNLPGVAQAQCAPDPTVANGTSTCTGNDSDGIRITTSATTLNVAPGSTVAGATTPAVTVDIAGGDYYPSATILANGTIAGGASSGISLLSGQNIYTGGGTSLALTVAKDAVVSGTTAITMGQSLGYPTGSTTLTIDNAGTLSGSSGVAISGDVTGTQYGYPATFSSITRLVNRAGGTISGSVVGPVGTLDNAGLIDGGNASALTVGNASAAYVAGEWTNTGTIRANSTAAVIVRAGNNTLDNSGTIANTGTGAAISNNQPAYFYAYAIQNRAGGTISSAGATAIANVGALRLTNLGTINGDVTTGDGASFVDSTGGRINGSVLFGAGDDTLIIRYTGGATPTTGITGAINGGGGTNTERFTIDSDTTLSAPITMLPGFQKLGIATAYGATTTLAPGFVAPGTIGLSGAGALVNTGTLAFTGQAFVDDLGDGIRSFTNTGTITANASGDAYALALFYTPTIVNTGTISVIGNGIQAGVNGTIVNSGAITATGTAVDAFDSELTNSGTIMSTGGIGVTLSGNVGYRATNTGRIVGATVGAETSIDLTNSGTILATNANGTAVVVDAYGSLINTAGGVVGNGGTAVTVNTFNNTVVNAGTINGSVIFTGAFSGANQRYIAQTGGILNGDLTLSAGSLLVTDLVNTGPGAFAGITGTVTAGAGASLRYRVSADASATLGPVGPFQMPGYELTNNATLTLTGQGTNTQALQLAGVGTVMLDATIATSTTPALQTTSPVYMPGSTYTPNALVITSAGALSVARTANTYPGSAVSLGAGDSFTNTGTISVTDRQTYGNTAAVSYGANVTNSGIILLDGGIGISNSTNVVNTGTIRQIAGGASAQGIVGVTTLDNRGTISVDGVAVSLRYLGRIVNSGSLESTGGVAITGSGAITNTATGTIRGTGGTAIQVSSSTFVNQGAVTGSVDLGYSPPYYSGQPTRSYGSSTYVADGGTITGDLLFGDGTDLLLQTSDTLGVSGIIDGGAGTNIYGRSLASSGTVDLTSSGLRNFTGRLIQAVGADTTVTITAPDTFTGDLYLAGDGNIVNQANITGALTTSLPIYGGALSDLLDGDHTPASLSNSGTVTGGVFADTASFTNTGAISASGGYGVAASLYGSPVLSFVNSGTIVGPGAASTPPYTYYAQSAVILSSDGAISASNTGQIGGGITAYLNDLGDADTLTLDFANSGTITSDRGAAASVGIESYYYYGGGTAGGSIRVDNSGTLSSQVTAASGLQATGLSLFEAYSDQPFAYTIANSGTISATVTGNTDGSTVPTLGLLVSGTGLTGTITNAASGTISATGQSAYAIVVADTALNLTNAGTISAIGSKTSVAIQTFDAFDNTIVNTGKIVGAIALGDGADTIDNAGTITGAIALGGGDDRFVQRAGGSVSGRIDGGSGLNSYIVDATGGTTTVTGAQLVNFASLTQTGNGTGVYAGEFGIDTIRLEGGTLAVAAGATLGTASATAITGGDTGVSIVNAGRIKGAVRLGAGDDSFTEVAGSRVSGGVDGGGGSNLYRVLLDGNRSGIGARTNFQHLSVGGTGTLALALDQNYQSVALAGTGLRAALGGFTIGRIDGSDGVETVAIDGDVAAVSLGGGNDTLSLGATTLAGRYDGGNGNDTLDLTARAPVLLTGSAVHFETISLAGGALTVAGTLGSGGTTLAFGDGAQALTVATGGTLAGVIDLGSGDDSFTLARGGTLAGTVAGGAGTDTVTLDFANGFTLASGTLTGFERLIAQGNGTLTLSGGAFGYTTATIAGDLTIAADATLATPQLVFGPNDNRLTIAGGFSGSVTGGAGNDSIDISGGSTAAPIAFGSVTGVEALRMSGGFATISGNAGFGVLSLAGGRLVGLAGSTISAPTITVGSNATFGSAGTVNGNLAVNGTLSPGASPGTMTVNGNVALAGSSVSVFEITPSVSDKLVVNGTVSIAQGATLQLVADQRVTPGTTRDLIIASGGITGSYSNIIKPAALFGVVVQQADKISLLGQFLNDAAFTPQVRRSIDYVNAVLVGGNASNALLTAVPQLVTASGTSNQTAFARLTPEAYASADQITIENGLQLADVGRSSAFGTQRETRGAFMFGSTLGNFRTLDSNAQGTSRAQINSYGFLGGLGWGSSDWSVGGFVGYLNGRQTLATLGARTTVDGVVAGVHARWTGAGIGARATLAFDGGNATTRRALPGGTAVGQYDRRGWTADFNLDYALRLTGNWRVRPSIGATAIRTEHDRVVETGSSAFALDVARSHDHAVFVDGAMEFSGGARDGAIVRPHLSVGVRYQVDGRTPYALAAFGGGGYGLLAAGAQRAPVLATATLGADVSVSSRMVLFGALNGESGDADHRASGHLGLRLQF
ncbi:autotransporter outer membrane beta-barrel domain-containing protein [Sphingomonas sp. H39-1-10]|uniref:autotransporter outer membrane beta-barrel domain-containing protein n=1 Tax=Sphingomonas pollutisoli TaxID=3030829 RepID=UPI0023B9C64B|nr:autotransporter outer membrane beta-barrel domain-containing protein [Sphingomonas pollutisoli]MDF0490979.1 autotransporter outer membrane beta-barrel domain-containing protein [Sphingomonas pollutisoli]